MKLVGQEEQLRVFTSKRSGQLIQAEPSKKGAERGQAMELEALAGRAVPEERRSREEAIELVALGDETLEGLVVLGTVVLAAGAVVLVTLEGLVVFRDVPLVELAVVVLDGAVVLLVGRVVLVKLVGLVALDVVLV